VVIGIVAVVALVLGTQAYLQWEENKSASELWPTLERAKQLLQAASAADPSQLASIEKFLQGHVSAHPGTRATVYSLYYLGSIAFNRGDYDLAVTRFRAGIATGKEAGIMKFLLREGIANSLEAKGDFPAAAAAYRDAGAAAEADMRTQSRMGEARVLGLAGKKTEAAALYRLILKETPETLLREVVEIRLAQSE
jgi:tetratricopeptide (TPR) repeat protein